MKIRVVSFCLLLLACGSAPADQLAIPQLVEQLGSADFKVREAAGRALESAGESALPMLRQVLNHADPEIRKRLTQLVARLEREAMLSPKLVTIKAEQKSAGEVFADIARQTGYQISCAQGNASAVTVHAENVPFWEAIDMVCRQSGHALQAYGNDVDGLTMQRIAQFSPHVCYAGPVRIAASGFHLSRSLDLSVRQQFNPLHSARSETLTFSMQLVGEPKAPLMSVGNPNLTLALDDQGNSLMPPQSRTHESNYHDYSYTPRNAMRQTQVQLLGPGSSQYVRHIKGIVPVTYLSEKRAELTISDILNVKEKKFETSQIVLEIEEVKELAGKQVHIRATARRNAGENQHDYSWTNSLALRMELVDDQGQKFASEGFNWDSGSPTSVTGTFQFNDGGNSKIGKPSKLIYYNWITARHEVSFEFKDLPLP